MKYYLFTLICIISINIANAQNVNIPDSIFKARLVDNPAINTNGDGEIQVTEAAAYNGVMEVQTFLGPFIWDLTGIEAFTALTGLDCSSNSISSLNLSANTALTRLNCYNNSLTSLDVSTNTALTYLNCKGWTASTNSITSLVLSANTALDTLICYTNALTSLNLSANTALTYIQCNDNALSSLDVSTNTALTYLYCAGNSLTSLNVQNGNNANFSTLNTTFNPSLTCIQVDNVANANSYTGVTFFKDAAASYSTNCLVTSIPEIGILDAVQISPNPANGFVTINGLNNIHKIDLINMQGQVVKTILVNDNSSLIDVSSFANGIYQLKLSNSDQAKTLRLVVAH